MPSRKRGKRPSVKSIKTKSKFNYKKVLKTIRGKINFDYDLRKPLTKYKKSRIKRAYRELSQYKSKRLVNPPRKRGENEQSYNRRIRAMKRAHGQDNTDIAGIFINAPSNAHYRTKKGGKVEWKFVNKSGRKVREKFIPLDGMQLVESPRGVAAQIFNAEAPFSRLWFTFGGFRGHTTIESPDVDEYGSFLDVMEAYIIYLVEKYPELAEFLNGIIVQY